MPLKGLHEFLLMYSVDSWYCPILIFIVDKVTDISPGAFPESGDDIAECDK